MQRAMKRARAISISVGAVAVALMAPAAAQAVDYTWATTAGGTLSWNDPANWTPNTAFPNAPTDTANLGVALTSDLTVHLNQPISVGELTLGGTAGPVITTVGGGTNVLTLDNTGGTVNNADGNTNASITSGGVAGSTNIIAAPVALLANTDITKASTNDLNLSGGIIVTSTTGSGVFPKLEVNLAPSQSIHIGNVTSTSTVAPTANISSDFWVANLNDSTPQWGTVYLDGVISNGAPVGGFNVNTILILGASGSNNGRGINTIVINGNNTFSGGTQLFRANTVLGSDTAFGTGSVKYGGGAASGAMGFNVASTDDSRNIANALTMQRNLTINGEHSLTWSGAVAQSNTSNFFNLLPDGKTFTFAGDLGTDTTGTGRAFTFDGPGRTVVSGRIIDNASDFGSNGTVQKNGTGPVLVTSITSDYHGANVANGGLLEFAAAGGFQGSVQTVVNPGGAIGLDTGSTDPTFLGLIAAAAIPSTGSLALAPADAAANLDFTTGTLAGPNLVGMSIGAVSGGTTYTGTITPAAAGYRLGGGGTLTLPNNNALTGANALTATNGGTVALTGTNNYTGATTIQGNWLVSNQQAAAANDGSSTFVPAGINQTTVLDVSHIADGASSIGNATSDASNLVINGGTLRYSGASDESTSHLITIGPLGATLDSSGAGAVTFSNTGSNVSADESAAITGDTSGNQIKNVSDVSQLAVGMTVSGGGLPAGTTITGIRPTVSFTSNIPNAEINTITLSASTTAAQTGAALTFTTQNRTLNLTGTNAGANTLAGGLGDSATGTLSVAKTGSGTWNLTGGLSYTGSTSVAAGTLSLATNLTTSSAINVSGGTLQLATGGGNNRVIVAPTPTITGGAIDLTENKMIVTTAGATGTWDPVAGAYNGVSGMVASGRNGGAWNGSGIITSSASPTSNLMTLGVAKIGDIKQIADTDTTTVAGQTVHGSDTLVMYTYGGDANLDGKINIDDYGRIDGNVGQSGTVFGWYNGDFNYDGKINIDDYGIIDGNIGLQGAPIPTVGGAVALDSAAAGVSAVPEPASLGLIALAGAGLLRRRRRRD